MSNVAFSQYRAVGESLQLDRLYSIMSELKNMKSPGLIENDYGSAWLGNLVEKLGGDWKSFDCRGSWSDLALDDAGLYFTVESPWNEPYEFRKFVESKFPGIRLYYQCEVFEEGVVHTNDEAGAYFPDRYYLSVEDEDTEYFTTFEALARRVTNLTGVDNLTCFDTCEEALEKHFSDGEIAYSIVECEVLDD